MSESAVDSKGLLRARRLAGALLMRTLKLTVVLVFVLVVVLALGYAALPWLVSSTAPFVASRLGLDELEITMGYPGPNELEITGLLATSEKFHLDANGGKLSYDLGELLDGRLRSVSFTTVSMVVSDGVVGSRDSRDGGAASEGDLNLPLLPFEVAAIDELDLVLDGVGFAARGDAAYEQKHLRLMLTGYQPALAVGWQGELDLDWSGALNARVYPKGSETATDDVLVVSSALNANFLEVSADVVVGDLALELLRELEPLPPGDGSLRLSVSTRLPWPPPAELDWRTLPARGTVDLDWRGDIQVSDASVEFELEDRDLQAVVRGEIAGKRGDVAYSARVPPGTRLGVSDGALDGGSGITFDVDAGEFTGSGELRSLNARLTPTLAGSVKLAVQLASDDVGLQGALEANVTSPSGNLVDDGLEGLALASDVVFSGQASIRNLEDLGDLEVPFRLEGKLDWPQLQLAGLATSGPLVDVPFTAVHDLDSGSGGLEVRHQLVVVRPFMASLLPQLALPFELDEGSLQVDLEARWAAAGSEAARRARRDGLIQASADVIVRDGVGRYEDYLASGITVKLPLRLDEKGWFVPPASVETQVLDAGVVLLDSVATFSWRGDVVSVEHLAAKLLGGSAAVGPFDYRLSDGAARAVVMLSEIDLGLVLALEGEEIEGSGTLNGRLPVLFEDDELTVSGGTVASIPPGGSIRLTRDLGGITGQPGLDFALRALNDFSYSSLEADVEYSSSGDLALAVRLKGSNPRVEGGRPIHYNLNITENLPVLLESLKLQDRLTERIEQQVRK